MGLIQENGTETSLDIQRQVPYERNTKTLRYSNRLDGGLKNPPASAILWNRDDFDESKASTTVQWGMQALVKFCSSIIFYRSRIR